MMFLRAFLDNMIIYREKIYMDKCPLCGSRFFFVRDPADEYEVNRFELRSEGCVFESGLDAQSELHPGREVFCDSCSWHGDVDQLEQKRR